MAQLFIVCVHGTFNIQEKKRVATAAATFEVMAAAAAATTKVKWTLATAGKIKILAVVAKLITTTTVVKTMTDDFTDI